MAKQTYKLIDPARLETGIFLIGPTEAAAILERNTHNRPISQAAVYRLAEEIKAGNWMLTPDAIAFSVGGTLVNGQHRLWAIIEAGSAVLCHVITDLPAESFPVIDAGRPRLGSDALSIAQFQQPKLAASIARLQACYEAREASLRMSSRAVLEVARGLPKLRVVTAAVSVVQKELARVCSPAVIGWVLMHALAQDADLARSWLTGVAKGVGLSEDDPRYVLRRRFLILETRSGLAWRMEQIYCAWRSWEMFRNGEACKRITMPSGRIGAELWPEIAEKPASNKKGTLKAV